MATNLLEERGVDIQGGVREEGVREGAEMFLEQSGEGRYRPRAVLIDPDAAAISEYSSFGLAAVPSVSSFEGSMNNWAKGYYEHGPDLSESILEQVRIQAERCETLENIHIVHSLGGGSGSGLGAYLLETMSEMEK